MAIHFHTVGRESVTLDVIGENTQLKDYILRKVGAGVSDEEQPVDQDDPFFVADMGRVLELHDRWVGALPRVQPFYAMKANPDPLLLKILAALGTGFDCCSKSEIQRVLSLDVSPDRIIYANTVKQVSHLQYAIGSGVRMMTFDCENELLKIKEHAPSASLLVRIRCDDAQAVYNLGRFGCTLPEACYLVRKAKELDLHLVGVCFHIGSLSKTPETYRLAIEMSAEVFKHAEKVGHRLSVLDIGGGFSGAHGTEELFNRMAAVISEALEKHFSRTMYPHVKIIAEPGRFFSCSLHTLALCVIGRKEDSSSLGYYLCDGRNGALRWYERIQDQTMTPKALLDKGSLCPCSLYGPTVDQGDKIDDNCLLPRDLDVGDWIFMEDAGDYQLQGASGFCGFNRRHVYHYVTDDKRERLSRLLQGTARE